MKNEVTKLENEACTKEVAKVKKNSKIRVKELKSTKAMKSSTGAAAKAGCVPCFAGKQH